MFVSPLASIVPTEVAAAALVIVGAMMMSQLRQIDISEFSVALPVVLTVAVMPFSYSIANGIGVGFIAWVVLRVGDRQGARDQPAAVDRGGGLRPLLRARVDRVAHRPVTVAYPAGSTGAPVQLASSLSAVSDGEPASAV